MRIVGGQFKNRQIAWPKGGATRPMTDEVREAIFNILGPIDGLSVLDVYAGSGAVGLEALSRGAAHVDGVEKNHQAAQAIRQNIRALELETRYKLYEQSVEAFLKPFARTVLTKKYGLVFADPPFAALDLDIVDRLGGVIKPKGILILKYSARLPEPKVDKLNLLENRRYGDSSVGFLQKSLEP